jgi:hypothetical protein
MEPLIRIYPFYPEEIMTTLYLTDFIIEAIVHGYERDYGNPDDAIVFDSMSTKRYFASMDLIK